MYPGETAIAGSTHTRLAAVLRRRGALDGAAAEWRVGSGLAMALFLVPVFGTLALFAARLNERLFLFLTREDGPLEWLQVLGFVVAGAFALLAGRLLQRRSDVRVAVLYLLLAASCVFLAGEEISWGQRLFGLETPGGLREVNVQDEITVHNILAVRTVLKLLVLALGAFALVGAPVIRRLAGRRPRELARLLAPPLFLASPFAILLGYNVVRFLLAPSSFLLEQEKNLTISRAGEWAEWCLAYGLACFAFLSWRRLRLLRSP